MTAESGGWGPYRSTIGDALAACEDYLGRLGRSLAGEIAPDRFYFGDKAEGLRDAAQALVDRVEDVEWWLGECSADVPGNPDQCGRSVGHAGPHQPAAASPEQRVLTEARSAATALRRLTDRLAWGLLTVRAGAGVADPCALADELRQVGVRLSRTASALEALEALGAAPAHAAGDH